MKAMENIRTTEDLKTIEYYDNESKIYSSKRYPTLVNTFVQYLFKKRLEIALDMVAPYEYDSVLELGCADGILLRQLVSRFPGKLSRLVGVDISPLMIKQARIMTPADMSIEYQMVSETPKEKFNLIMAIGFMNVQLWQNEISYLLGHLRADGYLLISFANLHSLHSMMKNEETSSSVLRATPSTYRKMLKVDFDIIAYKPYGFFVPKLWALPGFARFFQVFVDYLLAHILPSLFHEHLYLLRSRKH